MRQEDKKMLASIRRVTLSEGMILILRVILSGITLLGKMMILNEGMVLSDGI